MGVAFFLATVLPAALRVDQRNARRHASLARALLAQLSLALNAYCQEHSDFPPGPNAAMVEALGSEELLSTPPQMLSSQPPTLLVDPWGMPILYHACQVDASPGFFVYSRGPNMSDHGGQRDDICHAVLMDSEGGSYRLWQQRPTWFQSRPSREGDVEFGFASDTLPLIYRWLLGAKRDQIYCATSYISSRGGPEVPDTIPKSVPEFGSAALVHVNWLWRLEKTDPLRAQRIVTGFPEAVERHSPYFSD